MKKSFIVLCALLVASSVTTTRASDKCLSFSEARVRFPNQHLWWHHTVDGGGRCWDASGPTRRVGERSRVTERPQKEIKPAPSPPSQEPTILYPALVQGNAPDAQLLAGSPMTVGPLLIDIDEITAAPVPAASADENDCCWPPLEPPFRERWAEMPATWFFTAASMELQP